MDLQSRSDWGTPLDDDYDYGDPEPEEDPGYAVSFPLENKSFRPVHTLLGSDSLREAVLTVGTSNLDAGTVDDDRFFVNLERGAPLDLPPQLQHAAQRLSLHLKRKNVRAKRSVDIYTEFTWAEGPRFRANDPKVKELLDRHWLVNQWQMKGPERVRSLSIFGEQLYPAIIEEDGLLRVSSISPFRIRRVNRNPDDAEELVSVTTFLPGIHGHGHGHGTPVAGHDPHHDAAKSRGVDKHDPEHRNKRANEKHPGHPEHPADEGRTFEIIRPTHDGRKLQGDAFFFAANRISGATRGEPDMLSSIDWLEGLDGFTFGLLERANISQNIVYDIEYKGLRPQEIRKRVREFVRALRKSGGVYGHNENVELKLQVPKLGSSDAEQTIRILLRQIQSGTGLAGLFYGDAEDLTRSSASELSIPVAKMLQCRQAFIRDMLTIIFQYQIQIAREKGLLEGVTDFHFEIEMRRVFLRDIGTMAKAIVTLSEALAIGKEEQWIDNDEARIVYRAALEELGPLGQGSSNITGRNDDGDETTPNEAEAGDIMDRGRARGRDSEAGEADGNGAAGSPQRAVGAERG